MPANSGPSYKCKHFPPTYSRFNTKTTKYGKKIINKIYISNQFVTFSTSSNVNQYNNYSNFLFKSDTGDNSKFDEPVTVRDPSLNVNSELGLHGCDFNKVRSDTFTEVEQGGISELKRFESLSEGKKLTNSEETLSVSFKNPVPIQLTNTVTLENTSADLKVGGLGAIDFQSTLNDGMTCIVKKSKANTTRDLTNNLQDKMINLNPNYLILNSPPDVVCALSKCLRFDLKGRRKKKKKKKTIKELLSLCSKKETPPRKISTRGENNSLSSSSTSTPFCERKSDKTNWKVSPIELHHKKEAQNFKNNSFELISSEKSDTSSSPNDITTLFSELFVDESNRKSEGNDNVNEINLSVSNIKKYSNENSNESTVVPICDGEYTKCSTSQKSSYSDDIFQSMNSFSINKMETINTESKLIDFYDTIQLPFLGSIYQTQRNIKHNSKESFTGTNSPKCNKYDKTSISSNIDSCDLYSIKSFSRVGNVDDSENNLNISFDNVHDCKNCDDKCEQFVESEDYKKVIPGKKWKRSLLTAGKKNRVTLSTGGKYSVNVSATNASDFRFSLNPQSNNYRCSTIKHSFRRTCISQINELHEIKEQPSPAEDEVKKLQTDRQCSNSFFDTDDFMYEKTDYNADRDKDNKEPVEELDFTFLIHQQVADILQKNDLNKALLSVSPSSDDHKRYAKENVLNLCGLTSPVTFYEAYSEDYFRYCKKIGEGLFGEVFCYFPPGLKMRTVLKIIPIEGDRLVNCSPQKTYSEVFSEMCIAFSLSRLKNNINGNYTDGFCSLLKMSCLKGKYPTRLITLWNQYDKAKISENDSPIMFESEQLYIGLEMLHGGEPLEIYQFSSSRQSYSILLQVIYSLAVAEKAFEFEHRDLHWGNVLVSKTNDSKIKYMIDGMTYYLSSYGKKATVIDYTLSRIRSGNFDIYNDISKDEELFEAYGDYQFDIYRSMREDVNNNWQSFVPKSNVRWIHYLVSKCIKGVHYKTHHNTHKLYLRKMKRLRDKVLTFSSAADIINSLNKKLI